MKAREELLKKVPKEGFLKISQSQAAELSKERRVALIRKGNELFNQKKYDLAKKIFLTTGYSDGLIRLGNLYLDQKLPLEAFRMYWLAPDRKKVDAMLEKTVMIIKKWLEEGEQTLNEEENASSADRDQQTELSKAGYRYLKEGWLEDANASFNGILEINPENNYALVGLGEVARKQGNFQKAIEYYQACLQFHPGNKYALIGLADCYRAQSAYQKAIEIWEQYLNQDDQDVTVLTRIADAYRKGKNFEKSKALYLKALEIEVDNPYALNGLGHLHFDFKYYNEAVPYWERMLKNDPKNIKVMTSMGNCYRKTKDFHGGLPHFERALEIEPSNFYALFGIADCCRGMNRHKDSLEAWEKILDSDPNNKVIITRAGDAYRNLGDLEQAEIYYKRALNIEFDMYAVIGLALISKIRGDHLQAIESLTGLLVQNPKNHRLVIEIADSYVKLGNSEAAIDTITRFLRLGGMNARVSEMLKSLQKQ